MTGASLLFDTSWGSEVGKKERTKRECQGHSGRHEVQQKAMKKMGKRAMQDYFQHQSLASYLCTLTCKHTVSTIHIGSHNTLTPNSDLHTQVHTHCEHDIHRFTYYTHTNFRPPNTCIHMCMFSCACFHMNIYTYRFTQYTHTKLRPPHINTHIHTWLLACQHTYNRFTYCIFIDQYSFNN